MIYSRWRPDGGYDYFETPGSPNLGDDLPLPQLPSAAGGIGVPAQESGRPIPAGARPIGRGVIPQGFIAPAAPGDAVGTTGGDAGSYISMPLVCGIVGFFVGYAMYPWLRRNL